MRKGVSLTEVVIGSLILAIAFGGLLSTFVAVRKYINRANQRLIANDLASQTLNDLYRAVREDTWNTGTLAAGANIGPYTIDNQFYQDAGSVNRYTVTNVGNFRRISVIMNYD